MISRQIYLIIPIIYNIFLPIIDSLLVRYTLEKIVTDDRLNDSQIIRVRRVRVTTDLYWNSNGCSVYKIKKSAINDIYSKAIKKIDEGVVVSLRRNNVYGTHCSQKVTVNIEVTPRRPSVDPPVEGNDHNQ